MFETISWLSWMSLKIIHNNFQPHSWIFNIYELSITSLCCRAQCASPPPVIFWDLHRGLHRGLNNIWTLPNKWHWTWTWWTNSCCAGVLNFYSSANIWHFINNIAVFTLVHHCTVYLSFVLICSLYFLVVIRFSV